MIFVGCLALVPCYWSRCDGSESAEPRPASVRSAVERHTVPHCDRTEASVSAPPSESEETREETWRTLTLTHNIRPGLHCWNLLYLCQLLVCF